MPEKMSRSLAARDTDDARSSKFRRDSEVDDLLAASSIPDSRELIASLEKPEIFRGKNRD